MRYSEALEAQRHAYQLAPDDTEVIIRLAFSEHDFGDREAARRLYQEVIDLGSSKKIWMEIVYLVIPSLNDGSDEIRKLCRWIQTEIGSELPIHFNRFQPAYLLKNLPRPLCQPWKTAITSPKQKACSIYI